MSPLTPSTSWGLLIFGGMFLIGITMLILDSIERRVWEERQQDDEDLNF